MSSEEVMKRKNHTLRSLGQSELTHTTQKDWTFNWNLLGVVFSNNTLMEEIQPLSTQKNELKNRDESMSTAFSDFFELLNTWRKHPDHCFSKRHLFYKYE